MIYTKNLFPVLPGICYKISCVFAKQRAIKNLMAVDCLSSQVKFDKYRSIIFFNTNIPGDKCKMRKFLVMDFSKIRTSVGKHNGKYA